MRKVTLTKQEEDVLERGLQIREIEPDSAVENQLWVDLENRNIKLFKNDQTITLGSTTDTAEEVFTLTQEDIDRKYIMLSKAPIPQSVVFLPYGGIQQRNNIDFVVNGSIVSWSGKTLDGFLEQGEEIKISYGFLS
jgi:hypothetical protein